MILNLHSLVSGHNKVRSVPLGFTELMLSNRLCPQGLGISPLEAKAELSVVLEEQLTVPFLFGSPGDLFGNVYFPEAVSGKLCISG